MRQRPVYDLKLTNGCFDASIAFTHARVKLSSLIFIMRYVQMQPYLARSIRSDERACVYEFALYHFSNSFLAF